MDVEQQVKGVAKPRCAWLFAAPPSSPMAVTYTCSPITSAASIPPISLPHLQPLDQRGGQLVDGLPRRVAERRRHHGEVHRHGSETVRPAEACGLLGGYLPHEGEEGGGERAMAGVEELHATGKGEAAALQCEHPDIGIVG